MARVGFSMVSLGLLWFGLFLCLRKKTRKAPAGKRPSGEKSAGKRPAVKIPNTVMNVQNQICSQIFT